MTDIRTATLALVCLAALGLGGCGDDGGSSTSGGGSGGAGSGSGNGNGPSTDDASSSDSSSNAGPGSTSNVGSGTASGPTTAAGTGEATGAAVTTVAASGSVTGGGGDDPYAAERQECIDKINQLRATKGLPAYGRWGSAEECTDGQATSDEQSGTPHGAFGSCGESAQNECLGQGPGGISQCLDQMWAEKDQPGCAGCDACNGGFDPNCPNCDFFGDQTGDVCGHYVNMSALFFSEAACGFSDLGGWDTINFH